MPDTLWGVSAVNAPRMVLWEVVPRVTLGAPVPRQSWTVPPSHMGAVTHTCLQLQALTQLTHPVDGLGACLQKPFQCKRRLVRGTRDVAAYSSASQAESFKHI